MDNKGFTLIELLAIIVLLSLVTAIGSYAAITYIETSKEKSREILINNIKTASELYIDECTSGVSTLTCEKDITTDNNITTITINTDLQTLANNNFLSVTDNLILNEEQQNIGSCGISITKKIDENYKVTYTVTSISADTKCPQYN